jgi:hypothetical protein
MWDAWVNGLKHFEISAVPGSPAPVANNVLSEDGVAHLMMKERREPLMEERISQLLSHVHDLRAKIHRRQRAFLSTAAPPQLKVQEVHPVREVPPLVLPPEFHQKGRPRLINRGAPTLYHPATSKEDKLKHSLKPEQGLQHRIWSRGCS